MRAEPVRIRGVVYPSLRAASRALGVPYAAVHWHREKGTLDEVGAKSTEPVTMTFVVPACKADIISARVMELLQ